MKVRTTGSRRFALGLIGLGLLAGTASVTSDADASALAVARSRRVIVKGVPGDINGDRKADIALVGGANWWNTIAFGESLGNGQFNFVNNGAAYLPELAGTEEAATVMGDFDGNGCSDVALVGQYPATSSFNGSILVAYSDCAGNWNVQSVYSPNFIGDTALPNSENFAGDFNGDGLWDIATIAPGSNLVIAFGSLDGQFDSITAYSPGFLQWPYAQIAQFGQAPYGPAQYVVGDFNGDGYSDIALLDTWSYELGIAYGSASGAFTQVQGGSLLSSYAAGQNANVMLGGGQAVAGDFNGDGLTDIAVVGWNSTGGGTPSGTIIIGYSDNLYKQEGATFLVLESNTNATAFTQYLQNGTGGLLVAGDFNGDGLTDLAITNAQASYYPYPVTGTVPMLFSVPSGTEGLFNFTNYASASVAQVASTVNLSLDVLQISIPLSASTPSKYQFLERPVGVQAFVPGGNNGACYGCTNNPPPH